jgi:hypothetical protein
MCEGRGEAAGHTQRVLDRAVRAAIVLGSLLSLAGCIYGVTLRPGGPEEWAALWPFYLGGLVAVVLGWLDGAWQR